MAEETAVVLAFPPSPASRPKLAVSLGHYSSAGRKPANQDFHGALIPQGDLLASKGIALAIADGISTSDQGAVAAETAVKSFLTDYFATSQAWSVQTSAERVIAATNSWMHARNADRLGRTPTDAERERGMICTLSAMILKSRLAHIFHVGDARIMRIAGGRGEVLTEAHRVSLGGGESYLARAMGVGRHVEIDYSAVAIAAGDLFVLTTDGVHDHISAARIAEIALAANDLQEAARQIAGAALAAGSDDNVTIQIARIEHLPEGSLDDLLGRETMLPPAPRLVAGQDFEGYAILREIHSGSRSHVYLVRDHASNARRVLKVPATDHAEDPHQIRALLLEEWIARRIRHPHVLAAPPATRARDHAYAVADFVEGQSLAQWMRDNPEPDLARIRSLLGQIAAGLQALHRREILHRDLRPANVMIDGEGTAKIIDFGSAQVAGLDELSAVVNDSAFAGTLQFSAPELYLGIPASQASDIYSLGVIAYQMLSGALPFGPRPASAGSRAEQRRLRYRPLVEIDPSIPDWVDAAIAKAVAIEPGQRYTELSEFIYDLSHPNPSLMAPDPLPLLMRRPERVWQAVSAGLLILLLLSLWRGG